MQSAKPLGFHPPLFVLAPILSLYAYNADQTPLSSLGIALGVGFVVMGCVWWIVRALVKDRQRSAFITTIILMMLFSYGHVHATVLEWYCTRSQQIASFGAINMIHTMDVVFHFALLAIFATLLMVVVQRVARRDAWMKHSTSFLNVMGVVLCLTTLASITQYQWTTRRVLANEATDSTPAELEKSDTAQIEGATTTERDIYYIILDGYGRADYLQEFYGHENDEFIEGLRDRGFWVSDNSNSNYAWTFLSLPSALNYRYLDDLIQQVGPMSSDLRVPYQMIEDNQAARFLKSQGYTFVHVSSTWLGTLSNKYADRQVSFRQGIFRDEFLRILAQTTILTLVDSFIVEDLANIHLETFRGVPEIAEMREPTFAFVHFILPHHPFIFDRDGSVKKHVTRFNQFTAGKWKEKQAYIDQLVFVNQQILHTIDEILARSAEPPIIVLQSDHGPQVLDASEEGYRRARMGILNAYHFPGQEYDAAYDRMTPVNTFRFIFNRYFDQDLPILEDRINFSSFTTPYDTTDITDAVR